MIETVRKTAFLFSSNIGGVNYGFQITADTEEAARKQLLEALQQIVAELSNSAKAGTKPS